MKALWSSRSSTRYGVRSTVNQDPGDRAVALSVRGVPVSVRVLSTPSVYASPYSVLVVLGVLPDVKTTPYECLGGYRCGVISWYSRTRTNGPNGWLVVEPPTLSALFTEYSVRRHILHTPRRRHLALLRPEYSVFQVFSCQLHRYYH